MELTCPKCQGQMRQYERSGILVDQCGECRGIFLDRGELERLVDAETSWHGGAAPQPAPQPAGYRPDQGYRSDHGHRSDHGYRSDRGYQQPHHKKKRSFLEDLFD